MHPGMTNPLSDYLKGRSLSQASFARTHGWRQATISGWCNGVIPSIPLALEIERATGGKVTVAAWAAYAAEIGQAAPSDQPMKRAS